MRRFARWAVFAGLLVALPVRAGDGATQWDAPVVCKDLPAGVFVPTENWNKLDTEVRRLQTVETRLSAENESLRRAGPDVTSITVTAAIAVAVGLVSGFLIARTLAR